MHVSPAGVSPELRLFSSYNAAHDSGGRRRSRSRVVVLQGTSRTYGVRRVRTSGGSVVESPSSCPGSRAALGVRVASTKMAWDSGCTRMAKASSALSGPWTSSTAARSAPSTLIPFTTGISGHTKRRSRAGRTPISSTSTQQAGRASIPTTTGTGLPRSSSPGGCGRRWHRLESVRPKGQILMIKRMKTARRGRLDPARSGAGRNRAGKFLIIYYIIIYCLFYL